MTVLMNSKTYWKVRLAWARWRVKLVRSRVWGLKRRIRFCRPQRGPRQLELPFRQDGW